MDLLLRLVVSIIRLIIESSKAKPPVDASRPVSTPSRQPGVSAALARVDNLLGLVETSARAQLEKLAEYEQDLRAPLTEVLEGNVLPRVEALRKERQALEGPLAAQGLLAKGGDAEHYVAGVALLETLLGVTKEAIDQRSAAPQRALLGDADALAMACYEPVFQFAHRHNIRMVSSHPITLFYPGGTCIELAFLNEGLAPIGLPEEYRSQPWRWPAIAHEIAHDLFVSVPGMEEELISKLDLMLPAGDASVEVDTEQFRTLLFQSWLSEIFADAVGALMIGPAYLRSMVEIFRAPGAPEAVTTIGITRSGSLDPHPPRHLRVHMTSIFLSRMGHGSVADGLSQGWDRNHGSPQALLLPLGGNVHQLPVTEFLGLGASVIKRLYNAELRCLAGHRLADIPGLAFSSTHGRRAAKAKSLLASGRPVAFDARALIAAAAEAALEDPEAVPQINKAVQQSILGVGTGERPARIRALAQESASRARPGSRSQRAQRLVEALIVQELLGTERRGLQVGRMTPPYARERRSSI